MGKWLNVAAGKTKPKPAKPALPKTAKRAESVASKLTGPALSFRIQRYRQDSER